MTFALATATILSLIWGFVVLSAHVLEQSGDKILAALRGARESEMVLATKPVVLRHRVRSDAMRARAMPRSSEWRAAA